MEVILDRPDLNEARKLALQTYDIFKSVRGYYPNTPNSHFKGKLGEIAVEKFAQSLDLQFISHFREMTEESLKLCDIQIIHANSLPRVDVKTWTQAHWEDGGRCVTPKQIPKMLASVDVVLWCTTDMPDVKDMFDVDQYENVSVQFRGFSTSDEIASAPIRLTGWRKIINHQLEDSQLRSIRALVNIWTDS